MTHRHKPAISVTASLCMCSGAWERVWERFRFLEFDSGFTENAQEWDDELQPCRIPSAALWKRVHRRINTRHARAGKTHVHETSRRYTAWKNTQTDTHTQTQANVRMHAKQKQQAWNRAEGNKSVKRKKGGRTKECMKGFFSSVGCQQRLSHFLSICFLPCLFSCIFFYFLSFSLLITLSLKTDSAKEFVTVFCFSPAREGKLTKHKQLVTELKQIFQVTVLYLSIYFSQNFKLFTPCNSFKYHVIWCRSTLLSQHPKTNFSAHHAW